MTATAYRLPDWLGGHDVEILAVSEDGQAVTVAIRGRDADTNMRLSRDWLVVVQPPPSIDDPVKLPLELHYEHDERRSATTSLWLKDDDAGWTLVQVYEFGSGRFSLPVLLNVGQLRLLAQAAWQRANEVEAVR